MYKQVFLNPLTPKTPNTHCGHNEFAHRVFPRLVQKNGIAVIEELEASALSASHFLDWALSTTNEALPIDDDREKLYLRDISITLESVSNASLVILALTKPQETIGTYFIALLAPLSPPSNSDSAIRYFTLERSDSNSTALCEWVAEGEDNFSHRYLTSGPKPTARQFAEALTHYLEFTGATPGN